MDLNSATVMDEGTGKDNVGGRPRPGKEVSKTLIFEFAMLQSGKTIWKEQAEVAKTVQFEDEENKMRSSLGSSGRYLTIKPLVPQRHMIWQDSA